MSHVTPPPTVSMHADLGDYHILDFPQRLSPLHYVPVILGFTAVVNSPVYINAGHLCNVERSDINSWISIHIT